MLVLSQILAFANTQIGHAQNAATSPAARRSMVRHKAKADAKLDELARSAADGEKAALRRLAQHFLPRIRAHAQYLVGNRADADDITQEALLQVMRRVHQYRGEGALRCWVDKITSRIAVRKAKSASRFFKLTVDIEEVDLVEPGVDPLREQDLAQLRRHLLVLLQKLPPKQRRVLVLKLVFEHSIHEISEILEISPNTARDRLQVGRRKLRKLALHDPVLAGWLGEVRNG